MPRTQEPNLFTSETPSQWFGPKGRKQYRMNGYRRAGCRQCRKSLNTLVTEAAAGQVRLEQIETFLPQDGLPVWNIVTLDK